MLAMLQVSHKLHVVSAMLFLQMVVLITLSLALCLTLSYQLDCSEYRDCDCEYKSGYFKLECSKTITFKISSDQNLTVRCLSDKQTLKPPDFRLLNLRYLTLIECVGKSYFPHLIRMLPKAETINLKGDPTNLEQITNLLSMKMKNLMITSYKISHELLTDANSLQTLSITSCNIKLKPSFFDVTTKNLKKIVLAHNAISMIPHKLFRPVKSVEEIDMSFNNLVSLLGNPFQSLHYLKKLNLERNNLTLLTENMLLNLVNLEELILRGNNIRYMSPDALFIHEYFGRLNTIDLSYNNLTLWEQDDTVTVTPFSRIYREPHRLRLLDLRNNKIQRFLHEWMEFPCADVLDVRYNNITQIELPMLQRVFTFDKTLNLQDDVDLYADSALQKYNNTIFLKGNLVASDEKLLHLAQYYNFIRSNTSLKNMFDLNKLVCVKYTGQKQMYSCKLGKNLSEFCPASCSCSVRPWESIFVVDCEGRGLHQAPKLNVPRFFNIEVNLNHNLLITGPRAIDAFTDVTGLYLSHNRITSLEWIPSKIQELKVDDNKISFLNEKVISEIRSAKKFRYIELRHNPWICNCETFNLINLLKLLQPSGKVSLDDLFCINSSIQIVSLNYNEVCNVYKRLELTVLFVTLGMTVGIVAALCYKYKEEIRIVLSVRDLLPPIKFGCAPATNKVKDAFVCYTYEDEPFLLNELLPFLEGGFNPYMIGVHFRDWVAGEFITDQIARSMEEARRAIIILSPQFLRSKWGITEFRMAHDFAMQGQIKVIIILYKDVDFEEIPDEALKKYLSTRSYIRWTDKKFWTKLKSALPRVSDGLIIMSYKYLLEKEEGLISNE